MATDAARRALLVRSGLQGVAEWESDNGAFSDEELAAARGRVLGQIGGSIPKRSA